jgi:urease accessory protein
MKPSAEQSETELRASSFIRAALATSNPFDIVVLDAQARHIRRKLITCRRGDNVLVDLAKPVRLENGDCLVLEDGRFIEVIAAEEDLTEVRGRDAVHLAQLAWHIGNRHLEAQIEAERILIRHDPVIAHMLEHQGATVRNVSEAFQPEHGAYHSHEH